MKDELRKKNSITLFGNGERISNFIRKDLLIKKVLFFIKNENYGIFNIGDKNLTYKEFAENIISECGNENSKILLTTQGLKSKVYINTGKYNRLVQ